MKNTSYVFPFQKEPCIIEKRLKKNQEDKVILFSDNDLKGCFFMTKLDKDAQLIAVKSKAIRSDFSWVFPEEPQQDYLRIVIGPNLFIGTTNAQSQTISIDSGTCESFLIMVLPKKLLLYFITSLQYCRLVQLLKDATDTIDYLNDLNSFFDRMENHLQDDRLLVRTAQHIFDNFLLQLLQLIISQPKNNVLSNIEEFIDKHPKRVNYLI